MLAAVQSIVTREFRTLSRLVFFPAIVHALGSGLLAQDEYPRLQLFGGGSIVQRGIEWEKGGEFMGGWQASLTGNLQPKVGVTADFGGNYNAGKQFYQFMLGPSFRFWGGEFFGRALLGGANFRPGALPPSTGLAMALGFGLDKGCSADNGACWRASIDYLADHAGGQWKHAVRVGFGIVFNFHHTR